MAKPDNRADNVDRIQENINNTIENYHETEEYLALHEDEMNPEDVKDMKAKNKRRLESLEGFREEIKDEAQHQHNLQ